MTRACMEAFPVPLASPDLSNPCLPGPSPAERMRHTAQTVTRIHGQTAEANDFTPH